MRRWLERLAMAVVILLTIGVLLACWLPAYVGAMGVDRAAFRHRVRP